MCIFIIIIYIYIYTYIQGYSLGIPAYGDCGTIGILIALFVPIIKKNDIDRFNSLYEFVFGPVHGSDSGKFYEMIVEYIDGGYEPRILQDRGMPDFSDMLRQRLSVYLTDKHDDYNIAEKDKEQKQKKKDWDAYLKEIKQRNYWVEQIM